MLMLIWLGFGGCDSSKLTSVSGSLDIAFRRAEQDNRKLLVFAYPPNCDDCQRSIDYLDKSVEVRKILADFLIYKCPLNQIGNEYIRQIAATEIVNSMTYVFNSQGLLLSAFSGSITQNKLVSALSDAKVDSSGNKDFFNLMLKGYRLVEKPVVGPVELKEMLNKIEISIKKRPCFYNNYLAAKISRRLNNVDDANQYAAAALKEDDEYLLNLYQNQRKEMQYLTNASYKLTNEPYILFEKNDLNFGFCSSQSKLTVKYNFRNVGKVALNIKSVIPSCDCMRITWPETPIPPNKNGVIEVAYHDNTPGGFSKLIFVTSNAANGQETLELKGVIE